jgi:hypothetical protein
VSLTVKKKLASNTKIIPNYIGLSTTARDNFNADQMLVAIDDLVTCTDASLKHADFLALDFS